MKRFAATCLVVLLACAAAHAAEEITLLAGPPRAFGGRTVARTFAVGGAGERTILWRTRVLRGVIERGRDSVAAPGDWQCELQLPEVRSRIELIQEITLGESGQADPHRFGLELFPTNLLADCVAGGDNAPLGLVDKSGLVARALERAGVTARLIRTDIQSHRYYGEVIVVASPLSGRAEPANGLRQWVQAGGVVVLLEPAAEPAGIIRTNEAGFEVKAGAVPAVRPVVGGTHPLLEGLRASDFENWSGIRRTAVGTLIPSGDLPCRPLVVAQTDDGPMPVVLECRLGRGRLLVSQLEIVGQLGQEPIADLMLRNLTRFAAEIEPWPEPETCTYGLGKEAIRDGRFRPAEFILDPELERAPELSLLMTVIGPRSASPIRTRDDLAQRLRNGGHLLIEGAFEANAVSAVNDLFRAAWPPDPRFPVAELGMAGRPDAEEIEMNHSLRMAWHIAAEDVAKECAETTVTLHGSGDASEWGALASPGTLVKFERDDACVVFAAWPLVEEASPARERIRAQLARNLETHRREALQEGVSDAEIRRPTFRRTDR